jgi:transcriptional regulator with XRE-family HTH domain
MNVGFWPSPHKPQCDRVTSPTDLPTGKELPSAVKEAREAANLSQQEAAALAGVAVATISRWERGERTPSHRDVDYLLARYRDYRTRPTVTSGADDSAASTREAVSAANQAGFQAGWVAAIQHVRALLDEATRPEGAREYHTRPLDIPEPAPAPIARRRVK